MAEGVKRGEVDLSLVSVDSTARAHGRSAGSDPVRDGWRRLRGRHRLRLKAALLGRSWGGPTSKVRLAAGRKSRPLALVSTAGQVADNPQFIPGSTR